MILWGSPLLRFLPTDFWPIADTFGSTAVPVAAVGLTTDLLDAVSVAAVAVISVVCGGVGGDYPVFFSFQLSFISSISSFNFPVEVPENEIAIIKFYLVRNP